LLTAPKPTGGMIDLTRPALIGVHFYLKDPKDHLPAYFMPLFQQFDALHLTDKAVGYAAFLPDYDSIFVMAGHDPKK
jgi:hypothetical protein